MRYLFVICLALASVGTQADTYRWSDADGRTVVSDTPPPGRTKLTVKTGEKAETGNTLPFATKRAAEAFPVILYTSADCASDCKQARDLLNGRGIPFSEKLVQKPEEFEELKQLVGDAFVPSLKVGTQRSRGFDAAGYHNLLDLAGYPKTAPYGSKASGGTSK